MITLDEIAEAIEYVGPTSGATTPLDSLSASGFDVMPDDEFATTDFMQGIASILESIGAPIDGAMFTGLVLGLSAGAVLGRKDAVEMFDSVDDIDVLEGTDWVPHND